MTARGKSVEDKDQEDMFTAPQFSPKLEIMVLNIIILTTIFDAGRQRKKSLESQEWHLAMESCVHLMDLLARAESARTKWALQALNAAEAIICKSRACTGHKLYESSPQTTVQAHTYTLPYIHPMRPRPWIHTMSFLDIEFDDGALDNVKQVRSHS